jgi:hypothetical protein
VIDSLALKEGVFFIELIKEVKPKVYYNNSSMNKSTELLSIRIDLY